MSSSSDHQRHMLAASMTSSSSSSSSSSVPPSSSSRGQSIFDLLRPKKRDPKKREGCQHVIQVGGRVMDVAADCVCSFALVDVDGVCAVIYPRRSRNDSGR